jgi:hypothetical protein
MSYEKLLWRGAVVALSLFLAISGNAAQPTHKTQQSTKAATNAPAYQPGLEPRAIDVLKASSARLAAAKSMAFTAVVSYESPSRLGPPLVYSTRSLVLMQRPDKLRVITVADGPRSEFYYDGKTMTAFAVPENLVAVTDAPPTIDAALKVAYDKGAIYFPFTDVIVADPYKDLSDGLKIAFYIGQSEVVGGVPTDMVAYVTGDVFIQIWIGTNDKLPRRIYAIYLNDPARLRHVLELSDWILDGDVPANAFVSDAANGAARIAFARPDATDAPGMKPPPKSKPSKTQ